jgi:tRNA (guanine-N7-)-methyltransferase
MGQNKLQRFAEIATFPNVLQYPQGMKGKWNHFFKNNNPITLELACGKGEYAVGLGMLHPGRNFLGVDLKGNRIWVGAKKAIENKLENVGFLRTHIDKLADYFQPGEVDEIWITFPDPQLRLSRAKKRLTHPKFLRIYQQVLSPGGLIHLKTDSPDLFRFTKKVIQLFHLEIIEENADVKKSGDVKEELKITTHYEGLDIAGASTIHYICFRLNANLNNDLDDALMEELKAEASALTSGY